MPTSVEHHTQITIPYLCKKCTHIQPGDLTMRKRQNCNMIICIRHFTRIHTSIPELSYVYKIIPISMYVHVCTMYVAVYVSLLSRLLPVLQCCTQKMGGPGIHFHVTDDHVIVLKHGKGRNCEPPRSFYACRGHEC